MSLVGKVKEIFGVDDEPDNIYYTHMMERLNIGGSTEIEEWKLKKQVSLLIKTSCSSYKEPEDDE